METLKSFHLSKFFLLALLLPLCADPVAAGIDQPGHNIAVMIINCKDTLLFLNHYSGKDIVNDDTAKRNPEGYF